MRWARRLLCAKGKGAPPAVEDCDAAYLSDNLLRFDGAGRPGRQHQQQEVPVLVGTQAAATLEKESVAVLVDFGRPAIDAMRLPMLLRACLQLGNPTKRVAYANWVDLPDIAAQATQSNGFELVHVPAATVVTAKAPPTHMRMMIDLALLALPSPSHPVEHIPRHIVVATDIYMSFAFLSAQLPESTLWLVVPTFQHDLGSRRIGQVHAVTGKLKPPSY
ncbi:hypothetical protein DIPPA_03041 [Diplonema papillatum]|nr:hypothetical protein DIPPA_03041 [Diplonema papillatum]|eukprot:gene1190-1845_t